ncbi:DUF5684 domain-containing protein [Lujinxingia vulgaris]|nr:DUF5684 domain-containing protein [Lujinxingia vulgaris]
MLNALTTLSLLAQAQPELPIEDLLGGGLALVIMLISLAISLGLTLVMIASMWKIFTKAGEPGWAAIVPVYNGIVLAKICGKEPWWGILLIVPFANLVAMIILSLALAEAFGKDTVWGLGLILLPIVFYPMLAFGNAQYQGRRAMPAGAY